MKTPFSRVLLATLALATALLAVACSSGTSSAGTPAGDTPAAQTPAADSTSAPADSPTSSGAGAETAVPTTSSSSGERFVTVTEVSGTVEVQAGDSEAYSAASVGQVLTEGDALRTGDDSQATLTMDDGTVVVVSDNTSFQLNSLAGTAETPLTRLFLRFGELFSLRGTSLPDEATYEVETPSGVAAIRGSSIGVSYYLDTESGDVSCLEGDCTAAYEAQPPVELPGGSSIGLGDNGFEGGTEGLTPAQRQRWANAVGAAGSNGGPLASGVCHCDGATLTCDDGTSVPDFPRCSEQVTCTCGGTTTLTCSDGTSVENAQACAGNAPDVEYHCEGPNLVGSDGSVSYQDPQCIGEDTTCTCSSGDLVCSNGTTYRRDPSCQQDTGGGTQLPAGCQCDGINLYCGNQLVNRNARVCRPTGGITLPATCECVETNLFCRDQLVERDSLACVGGSADTPAGCECNGADLYCGGELKLASAPVCAVQGTAPEGCVCDGPNMTCRNGAFYANFPFCTGEATGNPRDCRCDGTTLSCPDGTQVPRFPLCTGTSGEPTGRPTPTPAPTATATSVDVQCRCVGPGAACTDGTIRTLVAQCVESCRCNGTTLECQDGVTIKDYRYCFENPGAVCGNGVCERGEAGVCLRDCGVLPPPTATATGHSSIQPTPTPTATATATAKPPTPTATATTKPPTPTATPTATPIPPTATPVVTCHCDGPDAVCSNGSTVKDARVCLSQCTCYGPLLQCPNNYSQPYAACAQDNNCTCDTGHIICKDGYDQPNPQVCPYCGDGVCSGDETKLNCFQDCRG